MWNVRNNNWDESYLWCKSFQWFPCCCHGLYDPNVSLQWKYPLFSETWNWWTKYYCERESVTFFFFVVDNLSGSGEDVFIWLRQNMLWGILFVLQLTWMLVIKNVGFVIVALLGSSGSWYKMLMKQFLIYIYTFFFLAIQ